MLETLNDYLSFVCLLLLNFLALRLLVGSLFDFKENTNIHKLWEAMAEYSNNEDE